MTTNISASTTKTQTINPGPGYRLLDYGETTQAGDEVLGSTGWEPALALKSIGSPVRFGYWRRKAESPYAAAAESVDPGYGYRILRGEEILVTGDDYFNPLDDRWHATSNPGIRADRHANLSPTLVYRRKIPTGTVPGTGYRLLTAGEWIDAGDEWWSEYQQRWVLTASPGSRVSDAGYRRKIDPTPQTRMIATARSGYRDPGEGYRVLGPDEVLRDGDEYWSTFCCWWPIGMSIGRTPKTAPRFEERTYRRNIEKERKEFLAKLPPASTEPSLTFGEVDPHIKVARLEQDLRTRAGLLTELRKQLGAATRERDKFLRALYEVRSAVRAQTNPVAKIVEEALKP
jgi:hypothetical protein